MKAKQDKIKTDYRNKRFYKFLYFCQCHTIVISNYTIQIPHGNPGAWAEDIASALLGTTIGHYFRIGLPDIGEHVLLYYRSSTWFVDIKHE